MLNCRHKSLNATGRRCYCQFSLNIDRRQDCGSARRRAQARRRAIFPARSRPQESIDRFLIETNCHSPAPGLPPLCHRHATARFRYIGRWQRESWEAAVNVGRWPISHIFSSICCLVLMVLISDPSFGVCSLCVGSLSSS